MNIPLIHLDYPLDKSSLLENYAELKKESTGYSDYRMNGYVIEDWTIIKYSNSYIDQIIKDFEIDASPRFYFLEPNAIIPDHVDNGTKCSVNFVLSDNPAPIKIDNVFYNYTQALLDTTKEHGVINGPEERILLKLSIFGETFEEVSQRIKFKR